MRIPPTVGSRPRWDHSSEPEYIYLSQEGYPLHARRAARLAAHPSPMKHVLNQSTNDIGSDPQLLSDLQEKVNPFHISSRGILMREFNRPFPRPPHRIAIDREKIETVGLSTPTWRSERQRVPGILWPSLHGTPVPLKTLRCARTVLESSTEEVRSFLTRFPQCLHATTFPARSPNTHSDIIPPDKLGAGFIRSRSHHRPPVPRSAAKVRILQSIAFSTKRGRC